MTCTLALCLPLIVEPQSSGQAQFDRIAALAIDSLRDAVAAGFRDARALRSDAVFRPIAGLPAFVEVQARLDSPGN